MRLWFLIVASLLVLTACMAPRPPSTVVQVGNMTYPSQMKVGGTNTIKLTLENKGSRTPNEIIVSVNHEFWDGFNLNSTEPPLTRQSQPGEGVMRNLRFPGLPPGQTQEYQISITAKKAGEYRLSGGIKADLEDVSPFSGRSVVNP